jgi:hypothetical protein
MISIHGLIQVFITISAQTMAKDLILTSKEAFRHRTLLPKDYRIASPLSKDRGTSYSWISHWHESRSTAGPKPPVEIIGMSLSIQLGALDQMPRAVDISMGIHRLVTHFYPFTSRYPFDLTCQH